MSKETPQVTSLEAMKAQSMPIVELPGWNDEDSIFVRMRKVSLLHLISSGQLPNELLAIAHKITSSEEGFNPIREGTPEELAEFNKLLHLMAQKSLIEPTYDEIVEHVGPLTDNQLSAIFVFCTAGVRALKNFRSRLTLIEAIGDNSEDVQLPTE